MGMNLELLSLNSHSFLKMDNVPGFAHQLNTPPQPNQLAGTAMMDLKENRTECGKQHAAETTDTTMFLSPENYKMPRQNVVSPPLTPNVSPSSILVDSMQLNKRKFSVDFGPFGYSSNPSQHLHDDYRRSSACDTMGHGSDTYPTATTTTTTTVTTAMVNHQQDINATLQNQIHPMGKPDTRRSSRMSTHGGNHLNGQPQHKHVCKYPFCGWSFKRYEHLKRHMLVHTGERPHVCHFPGCGKRFSRSDNFNAHTRTHTKRAAEQQSKKQAELGLSVQPSTGRKPKQQQRQQMYPHPPTSEHTENLEHSEHTKHAVDLEHSQHLEHTQHTQHNPQPLQHSLQAQGLDLYTDLYDRRPSAQMYSEHPMRSSFDMMTATSHYSPNNGLSSNVPIGLPSLLNHEPVSQATAAAAAAAAASGSFFLPPTYYSMAPQQPMMHTDTNSVSPLHLEQMVTTPDPSRRSSMPNPKSHVCPVPQCQRWFKRLEHLKRHMRIHTLERPFACAYPECHKTFSRSDNLSQHIKTHRRHETRQQYEQNSLATSLGQSHHLPTLQTQPQEMMADMHWTGSHC